ncbi:B12-binding domain-containing radical SAM protein [Paucidesulfovibrio longus]|uniref:B12-binding domain-containing radical SAM protein n=1 Tax=Paucidesulfovibrio longus TaxID=889 RepID=UPI0003B5F368|nr:radical SAM protein [Paucidesulfovibrio longus]
MDYQGRIIRPPSEAESILLQVTTGCSHGKCTFCGAYDGKRFSIKSPETISRDIRYAAAHFQDQRRLFLCDGDALIIPQKRLVALLDEIRAHLPWLTRIGSYANAKAARMKSDEELRELREHGLAMAYMGLESGRDETLRKVRKHGDAAFIVAQGRRLREAGMKLSVTVLLGLAGPDGSLAHARATGEALSAMDPDQAAALTLMLIPGTPLHAEAEAGRFRELTAREALLELREMLAATDLSRGLFLSDHASNRLPLRVRLPKGKNEALARIDAALAGDVTLKPEWLRRL